MKICHKSISDRDTVYYNSYLSEKENFDLSESLVIRFNHERKKYIDKPTFTTFDLTDNVRNGLRKSTYGFIQNFESRSIFVYNHMIVNRNEFIELEFSAEGNKLTKEYMKDEIEYIITQIEGMPMNSKR